MNGSICVVIIGIVGYVFGRLCIGGNGCFCFVSIFVVIWVLECGGIYSGVVVVIVV